MAPITSALAFAIGLTSGAPDPTPPWRFWDEPVSLARHRDDYTVVQRSSFSPDACGYDAQGNVIPDALHCRYDHLYRPDGRHRYLRVDAGELVLLDERGPGAIVRVWMTTGSGFSAPFPPDLRLRVRLDGNPIPAIDLPVAQWFDGSTWPFVWPLVGDRNSAAGASFSYVPIVFNDGAMVTLSGPDAAIDVRPIWYHFNVQRHARSSGMTSGIPADIDDAIAFAGTVPGDYPWPHKLDWQTASTIVGDGAEETLIERNGADTLLAMRIRVADPAHNASLSIRFDIDGTRRIDLPLHELFLSGDATGRDSRSSLQGIDVAGFGYLFLPAPFHASMRVTVAQAAGAGSADIDYAFAFRGEAPPADALRIAARRHDTCINAGRNAGDLALLDVSGHGRWLSLSTWQHNLPPANANFLEGDERVHVDHSPHVAWHGTGNEDFYNGGFYFDRGGNYGFAHAYPFAGAPWHAFAGKQLTSSQMYRSMIADALPFNSRLRVNLERGAYGDQPMCSRGVAFLYLEPGPMQVPVARLDLADPVSIAAAHYQAPDAICTSETLRYVDEPATSASGTVCRRKGGASTFRFTLDRPASQLWLRRRFDGNDGGQAGRIESAGATIGHLPYAMANPVRRWQDVDVPLDLPPQLEGAIVEFRVVPAEASAVFTESVYELIATAGERIFSDGFETTP